MHRNDQSARVTNVVAGWSLNLSWSRSLLTTSSGGYRQVIYIGALNRNRHRGLRFFLCDWFGACEVNAISLKP